MNTYEKNPIKKLIHDLSNPIGVVYGSLHMIQIQHPEVKNFKYWEQTINDLEEIKLLLNDYSSPETKLNT